MRPVYAFGAAHFDRSRYELLTARGAQRLTPTVLRLLTLLVEANGRVVSKDELMEQVWSGRFVGEGSLNRQISSLRKLLGDDPDQQTYIETIPRIGYRLVPDVTVLNDHTVNTLPISNQGSTFIGRSRERAAMDEAQNRLTSGKGGLLCVTGDAGLGKTALVSDFLKSVAAKNFHIGQAQCEENMAGTGMFLPLRDLLANLTANSPGAASAARPVSRHWRIRTGRQQHRERKKIVEASHHLLRKEFWAFIGALSRKRPVVVFLDDWHWADASSVDLVASAAFKWSDVPVLWILAYRSGELHRSNNAFSAVKADLQAHGACWEIPLEGWSVSEISDFLSIRFPKHAFRSEFPGRLFERTQGNPLFVIELLDHLHREGVITTFEGRWRLGHGTFEQSEPESLRRLIQRKIRRLTPNEHTVLAFASVQGYEFDSATVARSSGMHPLVVESHLKSIEERHEFIRTLGEQDLPNGERSVRFVFLHVLDQQTLYSTLTASKRVAASRAVARSLVSCHGIDPPDLRRQLGFLFEQAQDYKQAYHYFWAAADAVARVGGFQQAVILGARALALARQESKDPRASSALHEFLLRLAYWCWQVRSRESLEQAVAYCKELIEKKALLDSAYALLASTYVVQSSYALVPPALVLPASQRAARRALELNANQGHAHAALGFFHLFRFEFQAAATKLETAIRSEPDFATAYQWYAFVLLAKAQLKDALRMIRRAERLDPASLIISSQVGWVLYYCRRFNEAIDHLKGTLDMDPGFWRAYLNLGWCHLQTANGVEARSALEKAVTLNENPTTLAILAYGYARLGMTGKAETILDKLARYSFATPYWRSIALLSMNCRNEALDLLEQSYRDREWLLIFLSVEPALDSLKTEPRFRRLVQKVGLGQC